MPFLTPGRLLMLLVPIIMVIAGWLLLWPFAAGDRSPPDLGDTIGLATRSRLGMLNENAGACREALDRAGVAYRSIITATAPHACTINDGIAWTAGGARESRYAPAAPMLACPLAAGLALWEWHVVQPAAVSLLGSQVVRIDHFGSFACRRIYGRESGAWSQHARARAIDIAGVHLADGRRISVAASWVGNTPQSRFLHQIRDGACRVFGTTLSPDYNAAHRDHLHLEETHAGWSVCR